MIVHYRPQFKKDLKKLSKDKKISVAEAIRTFKLNPFDPSLLNHKLKGRLKGVRAFSAEFDLRILYREEGGHAIVIMLHVGKHEKVY